MSITAVFKGNYDYKSIIKVGENICTICKRSTTVISIDPSYGEFEPGHICNPCADRIVSLYHNRGAKEKTKLQTKG